MECSEARRLIDAGLRPGSSDARRAALGFHLAGCAACRAYRAHPGDAGLLAALLVEETASQPVAPPSAPAVARQTSRRTLRRPLQRRQKSWRPLLVALFGLMALAVGLVGGRAALALYTINANLAAMQVTAGPSATPALAVPSSVAATTSVALPATPLASRTAVVALLDPLAEPPPIEPTRRPATAASSPEPAFVASASPIRLPAIGVSNLPTLMPTFAVSPGTGAPLNILLLGSDRRPGESWTTRSDAIVVVHLDPRRQRVALLSLPRDLVVSIPGYGQDRINAVTVYGDLYPELGGGLELARETVSQLLDLPIQHVVRADFAAFTTAVDAIGGVDLLVEQELYDPQYPTMDYGYTEVYFPAGPQHMDGETALTFSRLRHSDSNYARNRRQQQVLQAIMARVSDQNVLGQVQMLADLSSALRDDIQTDLSLDQMLGIAWSFRNVSSETVERYALDETMVQEGVVAGDPYATFALPGAIEELTSQLVNGPEAE